MTVTIAGYHIQEKIYESENSLVYRGHRQAEGPFVILKMLKQAYPSPEKVAWFQREYELTQSLHLDGVIEAYGLTTDQHRPVMVLEDFGGESVELYLKKRQQRFTLAEFLPLSVRVADILSHVHQQRVVHKDVNPSNIVWNPRTGQVKLIDFGISTVLARENPVPRSPTVGEGSLAYISPEQTGRMNRILDYRTDLYSLGVTFYELLTGQLPFPTIDALALMHAHLARQPTPPEQLVPDFPQPLSTIILKLMAKNAEDRYQSAYSLKADLEECLRQWQSARRIDIFPLNRQDLEDRFHLPQKLYGRKAEIAMLLTAFERVSQGTGELMLVSGSAGIGKSALVREVYKPITRQHGYFITGKFEQFHKNIPYAPFTQAFRSLVQQLLTESVDQIAIWRERLLAALGPNGQVITNLVPEVALIIGPQPPEPALSSVEARNRLSLVFHNFIRVFTRPEHPLVLFLDDLQWADAASLNLVRLLLTFPDNQYLFVIGAYRDNETYETHPLMLALDEIHKAGSTINHIALRPLDAPHVCQFVAETLNSPSEGVQPLAALILAKTRGSPFFVNEFLRSLYTEGLLIFDLQRRGWKWDLTDIEARDITDNVVELMTGKLQRLGWQTQQVLKLAACVGNRFDLQTLATIYEHSVKETASALWAALEEGLVLPLGSAYKLMNLDVEGLSTEVEVAYKFAHDRIQQAAYSLIPETKKHAMHWRIGQLFLRNTLPSEREQKIFDIVDHMNLGRECITYQAERNALAELNLLAGKKAKAATAYGAACNYLQSGLEVLGASCWAEQYNLTLALYEEAVEAAYLNGDYVRMEQSAKIVLQQARTLLDKVKVYECSIEAGYAEQAKIREGIKTGLEVLELLGIRLPEQPSKEDVQRGLEETQLALHGKNIEDLVNLQEMKDPDKLAAVRIFMRLFSPAHVGSPELFSLINFGVVNLSIKYGNTPLSARAYASYGLLLCNILGDIDTGYRFGKLALSLVDRFRAKEVETSVTLMVNVFVRHWKEHIKETLQPLREAYKTGLETGAVEYAALAAYSYASQAFRIGKELGKLEKEVSEYGKVISQLKQGTILHLNNLLRQVILNLLGRTADPCRLVGESYNEEAMLPLLHEANNVNALARVFLNKLVLCYLFQDYPQAVAHAAMTERYFDGTQGASAVPLFFLYAALTYLAVFPNTEKSKQKSLLEKIAANQEKMNHWAQHAPMNCLHKFYLVEAELARVLGKAGDAREYYDQAITLAHENEYLNEEALAYELAGKFYLARGQTHQAHYYLHGAHYAYLRWGALAKVQDLEKNYPQFFATRAAPDFPQPETNTWTGSTEQHMPAALDARSVLKASQAITSEIILDRLLNALMKIVLENAGAQRAYLILERDGQLVIEAERDAETEKMQVLQSIPIEDRRDLPRSLLRYVARTQKCVVLNDATEEATFASDPYVVSVQPKSILCAPLLKQGKCTGMLYLENNLLAGAFTPERVEVLNVLASEAAISIENAQLYRSLEAANEQLATSNKTLEDRVTQRTYALQEKNQELERVNQHVQEASRRKSQFLAGMSHELRTPMNAILGFTRLVLRKAGDLLPERQQDNLLKVRESAEQLLGLINQLLDLSRLEAGRMDIHPTVFDVKQLIMACCDMVTPLVKPGVGFQQHIPDEIGNAVTDDEGLRHIVVNLLSNAIKFTDTGTVLVRVREDTNECGEKMLRIAVSDTGVGIPAEALDTIFEEFQQVEGGVRKREGTGLGLPIAKRWAELLGGTLTVMSELDHGSTFTVMLPLVYRGQSNRPAESMNL